MRKLLLASVAVLSASMGLASVANAQAPSPAPGTISVRLNGQVRFYAAYISDKDANTSTSKLANYDFLDYARLYPGFDGVAANGLKYGASLEIRQDQASGAGGGVYGGISQQDRARSALYFRREFGYLGTDQLGTVRVGTTDAPTSLYITGTFEGFDGGGLDGDIVGLPAGSTQITWPFPDVGNFYNTTKVVYLSPSFFGVDFGVSFEPNTGGESSGNNCGTGSPVGTTFVAAANGGVAGPGCDALASTTSGDISRRKNTFDGLLRYRGSLGPVGVAATAGYIGSSHVQDSTSPQRANPYQGFNIGDFGAVVTYAGVSVGGHYMTGRFTGQGGLARAGAPDGEAWLVGAQYATGPLIFGAHYLDYKYTGDLVAALAGRQKHDTGFAAGATYALVPGVTMFLSYAYQQTRQNGVNQVTGEDTGANAINKNRMHSNVIGIGTSFRW